MKILHFSQTDRNPFGENDSPLTVTEWANRITPVCSKSWLDNERARYWLALQDWNDGEIRRATKKQLHSNMLYTNTIAFFMAQKAGAIVKEGDQWVVDPSKLKELINGSIAGKLQITTAHLKMRLHGKKYFAGACSTVSALRTVRSHLQDLGLLDFEAVLPGSTFQPPTLQNVDFIGLLILHESCEREFFNRLIWDEEEQTDRQCNFNDLPDHHCAIVRTLFNHVFAGVSEYNRVGDEEYSGTEDFDDYSLEVYKPEVDPRYEIYEPKQALSACFWKRIFIKNLKHSGKYRSYQNGAIAAKEKPH